MESRRLRKYLVTVSKYAKGSDADRLFSVSTGDRTRRNSLNIQKGQFNLDIIKNCLIMSVVKHWNRFLSLVFKSRLGKHLARLV